MCNDTVLNRITHKTYLNGGTTQHQSLVHTKQLEHITKDHIAAHTVLIKLKTALFLSFLVV